MPRTLRFQSRWPAALTLAAALFAAAAAAHPSAASAQEDGFGGNWCNVGCALAGITLLAVPTTLLIAQGVYAADSRWFPPGWAVAELVVGMPMAAMGITGLFKGDSFEEGISIPAFSVVFGGLGLWFTTHAIISFIADGREQHRERAHARLTHWLGPMRFDL